MIHATQEAKTRMHAAILHATIEGQIWWAKHNAPLLDLPEFNPYPQKYDCALDDYRHIAGKPKVTQ